MGSIGIGLQMTTRYDKTLADYKSRKLKTVESMTSPRMIEAAASSVDGIEEQQRIRKVLSTVQADFPGGSEILRVSSSMNPYEISERDSRQAVDALVEAYLAAPVHSSDQLIQRAINPDSSNGILAISYGASVFILGIVALAVWESLQRFFRRENC